MKNLQKINQDKKHPFKYGTLILCLYFFFMNEVLGIGQVQWACDRLVAIQIRDFPHSIGDIKTQKSHSLGLF